MKIQIKHKLFLVLLLTSAVVASGLFYFLQWSVDRGFLNYVKSQELEQLDRLAEQLAVHYSKEKSWQFIVQNHSLWQRLHREIFIPPPGIESEGDQREVGGAFEPIPPARDPRGLGRRVLLFDAEKDPIIGGPPDAAKNNSILRPINNEGKIIGYLGLIPVKELSHTGDLLFIEQQTESFALITLGMVVMSLLLSYPFAIHLLRPINKLTEATRKLVSGQFKTRITATTRDELGQLSDDFNILSETLENNEKNRQRWVADISHELRTPLAILRGDIEALQDGIRQPGPQAIGALHGEVMHLERLVKDLYELSMSDIGALQYRRVKVSLVGILEGAIELFEPRMRQNGLELTADLSAGTSSLLLADPDRLQQLFTNLLENSLRYTDAPGKVELKLAVDKELIHIQFQDSMPGVSAAQLPRLFDRLYRGDGSRNRATGGAGLGLAICKNIVDGHQGKISAENSPLGGLLIKIELPLKT